MSEVQSLIERVEGLSDAERSELKWMGRANGRGVGLYFQSTRTHGPVEICDRLVDQGLARFDGGYWLTETGAALLRALQSQEEGR